MKTLPLVNSKELALVDDKDFEIFSQIKWRMVNYGYVMGYVKKQVALKYGLPHGACYLHRLLMNIPEGLTCDHKDLNKLNNQRFNLRTCTHKQNTCNRKKRSDAATSKFIGVHQNKLGFFFANIVIDGKQRHIRCSDEIQAAQTYNELAKKHYGEFARLNEV